MSTCTTAYFFMSLCLEKVSWGTILAIAYTIKYASNSCSCCTKVISSTMCSFPLKYTRMNYVYNIILAMDWELACSYMYICFIIISDAFTLRNYLIWCIYCKHACTIVCINIQTSTYKIHCIAMLSCLFILIIIS